MPISQLICAESVVLQSERYKIIPPVRCNAAFGKKVRDWYTCRPQSKFECTYLTSSLKELTVSDKDTTSIRFASGNCFQLQWLTFDLLRRPLPGPGPSHLHTEEAKHREKARDKGRMHERGQHLTASQDVEHTAYCL